MSKAELIVALDVESEDAAIAIAKELLPEVNFFKVGLQLFISSGPSIVEKLKALNDKARVFLDLKLHDIPNQVANAVTEASRMGADLLTVHTLGGKDMMSKAVDARDKSGTEMKIVGVTILTSMDNNDLESIGITVDVVTAVSDQAKLAVESRLDGLVSSGQEVGTLRRELGPVPLLVTPGIRPINTVDFNDQKRPVTALMAVEMGSDLLVVGRPIIHADNPRKMAISIKEEIDSVSS